MSDDEQSRNVQTVFVGGFLTVTSLLAWGTRPPTDYT